VTDRALRILISAGENSGDLYAAELAIELRRRHPNVEFFGCTGPKMRAAGVETVVDSASLAVVGLVEVVKHIPRIYGEFKKLLRVAERRKPDLAILTDSPDFHLRVAKRLKAKGVPVVYLVAPQVWAWRKDRLPMMRRVLDRLLCLFPFEEEFFRQNGIRATYIGHPLAHGLTAATLSGEEFANKYQLRGQYVALLPGSRIGEVGRHLPHLIEAIHRIREKRPDVRFVWATPREFWTRPGAENFRQPVSAASIQVIEGDTTNVIAHATLALAASGTVTVETAILGTPMITFYRVTGLSWLLGKLLVKVPFFSMPNLIANRLIVKELMQENMTGDKMATEALLLLENEESRQKMVLDLAAVTTALKGSKSGRPIAAAADEVDDLLWNVGLLKEKVSQ
jgi:lipid-A-disaccharide synthase